MIFPWHLGRKIRMLVLDVDGVLTDGIIHLDADGNEHKRFHVADGLGIRLLLEAGIGVGFITARRSLAVEKRALELSVSFVHQGVEDGKWQYLKEELDKAGIQPDQCACMGDDLVDLDILCRVGLATTPRNGQPEVKKRVHWVADYPGGRGAVRELAEGLLVSQGRWENIVSGFIPRLLVG